MHRSVVLAVLLIASPALAHFKLVSPANWADQDALGGPQKSAPCGQSDQNDPAMPTNAPPTQLMTGSMVTITVNETIFHPGHYRVSLAQDMASLPADPAVTPGGGTACGSTPINPTPTMPLLADGLLVHTQSFSGNQTMQVQLPAGMTCTNCILQVTEFMSAHAAPCYYHHCAMVTVTDNPQGNGDATIEVEDGCCSTSGNPTSALLALGVALSLWRRGRSRSRSSRRA